MKCLQCLRAGLHACVSFYVFMCHVFIQTFISHLFMKIFSPNWQRMFIAVKTCL